MRAPNHKILQGSATKFPRVGSKHLAYGDKREKCRNKVETKYFCSESFQPIPHKIGSMINAAPKRNKKCQGSPKLYGLNRLLKVTPCAHACTCASKSICCFC